MMFRSRSEGYMYTLCLLDIMYKKFANNSEESIAIKKAISGIRVLLENHEKDTSIASDFLLNIPINIVNKLNLDLNKLLKDTANNLAISNYTQTKEEKWSNPFGRRFESQLQIELLLNPTDLMMASVRKISNRIIKIIKYDPSIGELFVKTLSEMSHVISFGAFKDEPLVKDVTKILLENSPQNLTQIMFMHFKFAQGCSRDLSPDIFGYLSENIGYICDTRMYGSNYYRDRGRSKDKLDDNRTTQMGLIVEEDSDFNKELPKLNTNNASWVADCKNQKPDLESAYTISLLENDTPYVAGPSGMTSLLMAQMLGYNVLNDKERKGYFASVAGYIVAGGFHSLHEVLGPIRHCLAEEQILPETYPNNIPRKKNLGSPPRFNDFYNQMSRIDEQFQELIDTGYSKLNEFILSMYEELKDQNLNRLALEGISYYNNRQYGFIEGLSHGEKGKVRARNFQKILENVKTDFQSAVIVYALITNDDGLRLKQDVVLSLGYDDINVAIKILYSLIMNEVKKIYNDDADIKFHKIESRINAFVENIQDQANNNLPQDKCYQSSEKPGVFKLPLDKLYAIEKKLRMTQNEEHNKDSQDKKRP